MAETRGNVSRWRAEEGGNSVAVVAGNSVSFPVSRDRGVSAVGRRVAGVFRGGGGGIGGEVGGNRGGGRAAARGTMFLLPGGGDVAGRTGGGEGGNGGVVGRSGCARL